MYRAFTKYKINEHCAGTSVAWHRNYFNITLGIFGRLLSQMDRYAIADQTRYITEPLTLMFCTEVSLKKMNSLWNMSLKMSNFDEFELERLHEPTFSLSGKYVLSDHLKFHLHTGLKPTGMANLTGQFYEIFTQIQVKYDFKNK